MNIDEISRKLENLAPEFERTLGQVFSLSELEELRVKFLGRKGFLAEIMQQLPSLSTQDRPAIGKLANIVKQSVQTLFEEKEKLLKVLQASEELQGFDATLPGRKPALGSLHPVTIVIQEICDVLGELGFKVASGPEVETDFYNFEAMNLAKDHPARDMQDTFYIIDKILLRTHTSPVQARSMMANNPPLAIIAPGKVYRRDSDITHSPMFHQIEGLLVDENVTMAELRGTLSYFLQRIFGSEIKTRFRSSFFPFTEPSAEVDISCVICNGKGHLTDNTACRVCKGTGWLEILGCGMVDPAVFANVGYDSKYSGFAFGLGVERIAMLKYGISDLRLFFDNDLRFLHQFTTL